MTTRLPHVFAVLDTMSQYPMKYYIFTTTSSDDIVNMKTTNTYNESGFNEQYRPEIKNIQITFNNTRSSLKCWSTGMSIVSAYDVIPIYEFELPIFTNETGLRLPLSPVYVCITNKSIQATRKRIITNQRDNLLHAVPQRIEEVRVPLLDNSFTLPQHAAEAIVRSLILDKRECCISTDSFDQISVIGITPCFHCFEYEALEGWLSRHKTCPECRATVKNSVKFARN